MTILFHGAGSANIGGANLIIHEGGLSRSKVICTNSKGVIWKSSDGQSGSFRNDEQKALAQVGQPSYAQDLVTIIQNVKPDAIIGAVGRAPNCFTKGVIQALLDVQDAKPKAQQVRPIVFALSNPKTQAEITAKDAYSFSNGRVIFGSGTRFEAVTVAGKEREPGQVNNFFIFPGMSFGAMCCKAKYIPERFFMVAAEAVANCLDKHDIETESVVPHPERSKDVALAVSTAVVLEAQKMNLAEEVLGKGKEEVQAALKQRMWVPKGLETGCTGRRRSRTEMDFGNEEVGHRRMADQLDSL